MSARYKRDLMGNVNKPQERMLFPFYGACLVICLCLLYFGYLLMAHPLFFNPGKYLPLAEKENFVVVKRNMIYFTFLAVLSLLFLIYWAYYVSNKILGAYERILNELDAMTAAKTKRPLKVRAGDDGMFTQLIIRINKFVLGSNKKL